MSGAPEKVKKSKRRSEKRIERKRNQRRKCGNICVRLIFCGNIAVQKSVDHVTAYCRLKLITWFGGGDSLTFILFLYVTEDEEMNCLLRCSCWTFEEHMSVVSIHIWCLSICLMFMCILYCHLNCMTWTGRPFVRLCNLWSFSGNQICTSLPLKNHSCPVIKFTGKQTALAFYIFSPEFL